MFYFVLPLYSFWHLDDFSWGSTRVVADEPSNKTIISADALDEEHGSTDALGSNEDTIVIDALDDDTSVVLKKGDA